MESPVNCTFIIYNWYTEGINTKISKGFDIIARAKVRMASYSRVLAVAPYGKIWSL